jgi:hypothetical protein
MANGAINKSFLTSITPQMKAIILENIARHYGISQSQAFDEVTDEEAESIMDYVTGKDRAAVSAIYQKFCLQAGIQIGR